MELHSSLWHILEATGSSYSRFFNSSEFTLRPGLPHRIRHTNRQQDQHASATTQQMDARQQQERHWTGRLTTGRRWSSTIIPGPREKRNPCSWEGPGYHKKSAANDNWGPVLLLWGVVNSWMSRFSTTLSLNLKFSDSVVENHCHNANVMNWSLADKLGLKKELLEKPIEAKSLNGEKLSSITHVTEPI